MYIEKNGCHLLIKFQCAKMCRQDKCSEYISKKTKYISEMNNKNEVMYGYKHAINVMQN